MVKILNETYLVKAIDLSHDGLGVTKLESGYTVFVEDLLKGESARIEITERKKSFAFGKVIERLNRSPYRQAPKCKHFFECGGCELMHMDYDVQSAFKRYRLELMLKKLKCENTEVDETVSMINPYYYRNKVEIKFSQGDEGIKAGFFKAKSHQVVNLEECHIMGKKSFELLAVLKKLFDKYKVEAYDSEKNTGIIKSAVIRESNKFKETVLLINTSLDSIPNEEDIISGLKSRFPDLKSIGICNTIDESSFSEEEIRLVHGEGFIKDELLGKRFEIGFRSFFQVNTIQAERLYKKAIDFAEFTGKEKVIDAYCGIGSIGISIADKVGKVFGIEIIKPAIIDAKRNARLNEVKNALFEVGNVDKVLLKWKNYKFDFIIIDPPRKGCSRVLLKTIIDMKIPKIIYISCNPSTLARDIDYLMMNGFSVMKIAPIDMFPQTSHVESVSLLSLK